MPLPPPPAFLVARTHDCSVSPGLTGLCVGYELGAWRMEQFADHLIDWLPEFALSWSELQSFHAGNARQLVRRAARVVYDTDKYERRGEFGEIILHVAMRQVFGSLPAISKVYYKDAANDTVKGFDGVHVVEADGALELWLGEAKFYSNIADAVRDSCDSLRAHTNPDYMRTEFTAILSKLDPASPYADRLKAMLRPEVSLDDIFDAIVVPVLLTYDSAAVASFTEVCEAYAAAFESEVRRHHAVFAARNPLTVVRVHLFLLPLKEKATLLARLHDKLRLWQEA